MHGSQADTNPEALERLVAGDGMSGVPAGFTRLPTGEGFNLLFGPLFAKVEDGDPVIAFRILDRHINPHGSCHGGALATFADLQAYTGQYKAGLQAITPTVSMTMDFISPAVLGDWVEARTDLLRRTKTMIFTSTVARVGERAIFRSSAIFRIGPDAEQTGSAMGAFLRSIERSSAPGQT